MLTDILINEELGTDYGAPSWYRPHNSLTTRDQARLVQAYYQRSTLPWLPRPDTISALNYPAYDVNSNNPSATATHNGWTKQFYRPYRPTDKNTQLHPPAAAAAAAPPPLVPPTASPNKSNRSAGPLTITMGSTAPFVLAIILDRDTGYITLNYIASAPGDSSQATYSGPSWTSKNLQLQQSTLVIWTTGLETHYAPIPHPVTSYSDLLAPNPSSYFITMIASTGGSPSLSARQIITMFFTLTPQLP
jgi:hypothetical protein